MNSIKLKSQIIIILLFSLTNKVINCQIDTKNSSPQIFYEDDAILKFGVSPQQKTYDFNIRLYLSEQVLLKNDMVAVDWTYGYDFDREQFISNGGTALVPYFFTDSKINDGYDLFALIFLSAISATIPEGFTYSVIVNKNFQINLSPKPLQSRNHKEIKGLLNFYSSMEVSVDFVSNDGVFIFSPNYNIGTFWNHSESNHGFGLKVGMLIN